MRSILTKVPAMIAMVIGVLVALGFGVLMFLLPLENSVIHPGVGFAWLVFDFLFIALTLILYMNDAILSIIKSCMGIDPIFNIVLSSTIFVTIIVSLILILCLPIIHAVVILILWGLLCLLYLAIFILEIISIVKHAKGKTQKVAAT